MVTSNGLPHEKMAVHIDEKRQEEPVNNQEQRRAFEALDESALESPEAPRHDPHNTQHLRGPRRSREIPDSRCRARCGDGRSVPRCVPPRCCLLFVDKSESLLLRAETELWQCGVVGSQLHEEARELGVSGGGSTCQRPGKDVALPLLEQVEAGGLGVQVPQSRRRRRESCRWGFRVDAIQANKAG